MLTTGQWTAIGVALAVLAVLYFGFDIVPKQQKDLEKSRTLAVEATSVQNLIMEAKTELGAEFGVIEALNMELNGENNDSLKVNKLETLSSKWYQLGYPAISAYYAEEIAKLKETEEAWSIAGTTYSIALKESEAEKTRTWAFQRAVRAFESAISINPDNIDHRINLALGYIENPPQENPMKGILMLRELNDQDPDNVKVLLQLGRLSLMTNQTENALQRLHRAEELAPNNKNVVCLLAQAYQQAGDTNNAERYNKKCIN